ncbi:hypothetical protein ACIRL3_15770 [Streptomyces sp. NPDC102384]|uniref:hypothetical protein n=1 Tax=Streptomyces sp. NPDC102384 TaxID=3366166 RepID=UPI0038295F32
MSLSQALLVVVVGFLTVAFAGVAAAVVHVRPAYQAPLTTAFAAVSLVAVVLGVLVAATS